MGVIVSVLVLLNSILGSFGVVIEPPRLPPALILRGTVVTMDDNGTVVPNGRVLVAAGRIVSVWGGTTSPPELDAYSPTVIDAGPGGLIFPGLINLHDHPSYGVLPLFPAPSSHAQPSVGRPLGTEPYANRYQWNQEPSSEQFDRLVESAEFLLTEPAGLGLASEAVKRAEVEGLLGGQTSIQGAQADPATDLLLARNVDNGAFGRDRIDTRVRAVTDESFARDDVPLLKLRMQGGLVDAWIVHLGEGVRDGSRRPGDAHSSRAELDHIRQLGMLNDTTVVVHGAGLEAEDFAAMRAAPAARVTGVGDGRGAKLVWSPLTNMLLYGETARVTDALAAGVTVALGTDWGPSGSSNLLGELKVADALLHHADHPAGNPADAGLSRVALDRALVAMVTRDAARTVRWDPEVGSVEAGKVADLMVLTPPSVSPTPGTVASPYRSLIDATEEDVRLVLVGGDPVAGDISHMSVLKPDDFEVVASPEGGFSKAVDVTNPDVPEGTQTFAQITAALEEGLQALGGDEPAPGPALPTRTWSHLKARVDFGAWAGASDAAFASEFLLPTYGSGEKVNLEAIKIDPLFTVDDRFSFDLLEGAAATSLHAPFGTYPANVNQQLPSSNPFAAAVFRDRWWLAGS